MVNTIESLSVVIPTYNEAANVAELVSRLKAVLVGTRVEILFVDDSPGPETVMAIQEADRAWGSSDFQVHWYYRGEDSWGGLSGAVSDGLYQALYETVVVMDGDLQHPPEAIPAMLAAAESTHNVVIASRYCNGGSANGLNSAVRGFVSWGSTKLAKLLFPLALKGVTDPMTGFFLVRRSALDLDLLQPRGFKILLEILVRHRGLGVAEIPFAFAKRTNGQSKGSIKRGLEYFRQLLQLRFDTLATRHVAIVKHQVAADDGENSVTAVKSIWYYRLRLVTVLAFLITASYALVGADNLGLAFLVFISLGMFAQAAMECWRMLYSYREPDTVDDLQFPAATQNPHERFCLIVPARHEAAVLATTLRGLARQTHPNVTVISVICDDDIDTLVVARQAAAESDRIEVLTYPLPDGVKPSKPLQLNYAFEQIRHRGFTILGIIDAEDTVHPELLMHVDAAFEDQETQIVQGGVQLMNHDSSWYSLHNVLEYWRWFSNVMKFQADQGFVPLGGNTVFLRHELVDQAGGWPMSLTEDCALGVLLSTRFNAKVSTYYDANLTTQEETPATLKSFFYQRVRWNQGFFSEWRKGLWRELPTLRKRLMAIYILTNPLFQAFSTIMIPITLYTMIQVKAPVGIVMLMYVPLVPLCLQLMLNAVYLHDFGRAFGRRIRVRDYVNLFGTHFFYQLVLNVAALYAMIRELRGNQTWHKTAHAGLHRDDIPEETLVTAEEVA